MHDMAKKLQLQVPTPCHENWETMTQSEKGRFCASCQKQVIDFSNKSDREIAMFFKKRSTGSVCGRFMEDQLNRDIEIPKKRIPWLKYFFQFAIPAFLVSCDNRMQGKVKVAGELGVPETAKEIVPKEVCTTTVGIILTEINFVKDTFPPLVSTPTTDPIIIEEISEGDIDTISLQVPTVIFLDSNLAYIEADSLSSLKGKVVDEEGKPIPFATILVKNTSNAVEADVNGLFSIQTKPNERNIMLVASSVGYCAKEIQIDLSNRENPDTIVLVPMKPQLSGEVLVVGDTVTNAKKKKQIPLLQQIFKDTAFSNFKIYPNPIRSHSTLTIELNQKQYGDHLLQLFNQSGQLIVSKDIYINEKTRLFTMNIPSIISGNYFLKLTSKATGRSYTEKLIVN
jgi:hypothetical protein